MRWPWVSRDAYDILRARFDGLQGSAVVAAQFQDRLYASLADEERRYTDLLAKYHELRVTKGAEPPAPVPQPRAIVEPSPIEEAINERAGTNPSLRRYLTNYGNTQMRKGGDEELVAQSIRRWRDPDTDD